MKIIDAHLHTSFKRKDFIKTAKKIGNKISSSTKTKIKEALDYIDNYDKILYGSDWPLVNMKDYIKIIKSIIPKKHHKEVFHENAKNLFKL